MSLHPMPWRSFRKALVADAVLRHKQFMSIPPLKQETDMGITPHHVLGLKDLVVSTRHNEHTQAQKHLFRLHQPGAVK